MKKQISITLEQNINTVNKQTWPDGTGPGCSPTTTTVEASREYIIVSMRNAVILDWDSRKLRVGDRLTEKEADSLSRCKVFEVTTKA